MKKILLACLIFLNAIAFAQQGLEKIIVEKYYVSDANDEANASGSAVPLPAGSITYRVFVDMLQGYKLKSVYGTSKHTLLIKTSTTFYNNEFRGSHTANGISYSELKKNTVMLDSWVSVGAAASNQAGILKPYDNNGAIANVNGILQNDDPSAGIPIKTRDGLIPAYSNAVTLIGIAPEISEIFGNKNAKSGLFSTSNGSIVSSTGSVGPTNDNQVLIGQFTVNGNGTFAFELNIQIISPSGKVLKYVARNPEMGEVKHPGLIYPEEIEPNISPIVHITAPADGATFVTGATVAIHAAASDSDGTVSKVEFFVNGVSINTDNTSPYAAMWIAGKGTSVIKAVATDNKGATGVDSITVVVSDSTIANKAPTVDITDPIDGATFNTGTTIAIEATAADNDGTVTQVEFYVNGTFINADNTAPYSAMWSAVKGTAVIKAVATDNKGAMGVDSITVLVTDSIINKAPVVYITDPANGSTFITGTTVDIKATASDSDGTVSQVEFYVDGTFISSDNTSPYAATWISALEGTFMIKAIATDNKGATGIDSIKVIIKDSTTANIPPVVSITNPANGAVFTSATVVSITAAASDSDGTVGKVEFYINGIKVGEDDTAPYQYDWIAVEGTADLVAVATDNKGAKSMSDVVTITVRKKDNCDSLKVNAGDDKVVKSGYNPQSCVLLTASVTGGKSPYSYKWSNGKASGSIVVCPSSSTTYTVTVTDKNGCTATNDVYVCVENVRCQINRVLVCRTYKFQGKIYSQYTYCVTQNTAFLLVNYHNTNTINWSIGSCNNTDCDSIISKVNAGVEFTGEENLTIEERALIYGSSIKLYPNPTKSSDVYLELTDIADEKAQVTVRDVLGKVVYNEQIISNGTVRKQLNFRNELSKGTYIVTVTTGQTVINEKLIIK